MVCVVVLVQSSASACKKIEEGDEIVYVDKHTVVSGILLIHANDCFINIINI